MNWSDLRRSLLGDRSKSILPPRVKLPVLSQAAVQFAKRAEDPRATSRELGAIIERDTGLTCELLRHVNGSAHGMRQKAATAQHAIAMLGVGQSKSFLLTCALQRVMRNCESKMINLTNFAATNLERALMAKEVARLLNVDPEVAFTAAMVQDFLLPIVTNQMFSTYFEFIKNQNEHRPSLIEFEQKTFGWDHGLASAHVLFGWSFPDELVCCVLLHHRGLGMLKDPTFGRTAVAAVAVAALMPDVIEQVPDALTQLRQLEKAWPAFQLNQIAQTVQQQFETLSPGATNYIPLVRRCRKEPAATRA